MDDNDTLFTINIGYEEWLSLQYYQRRLTLPCLNEERC